MISQRSTRGDANATMAAKINECKTVELGKILGARSSFKQGEFLQRNEGPARRAVNASIPSIGGAPPG